MSREERQNTREEEGRNERMPLGKMRLSGKFPKRKGYIRRVISDIGSRLQMAESGGWAFVLKPNRTNTDGKQLPDSRVTRISKQVRSDGMPLVQYLMEISEELYNKDQKEKDKHRIEQERAMRRGEDGYGSPGRDGRYIPNVNQ